MIEIEVKKDGSLRVDCTEDKEVLRRRVPAWYSPTASAEPALSRTA